MYDRNISPFNQKHVNRTLAQLLGLIIVLLPVVIPVTADAESPSTYIVIIGPPGSGKSTNAESLSEELGVPAINMGQVLTDQIEKNSRTTGLAGRKGGARAAARAQRSSRIKKAQENLAAGELVTDDTLNAIVATEVLSESAQNGFILDGYPGSVEQAEFLDNLLESTGIEKLIVIYLDVPDEVALERMKDRNRADDKEGFAQQRLGQFRGQIQPLLDYYHDDGLITVDATPALWQVKRDVLEAIERNAQAEKAAN